MARADGSEKREVSWAETDYQDHEKVGRVDSVVTSFGLRLSLAAVLPCMSLVSTLTVAVAEPLSPASQPEVVLDPPYLDPSAGFSIRPPAGCAIIREQQYIGRADVELVRFVNASLEWALAVRRTKTTRPLDGQAIIEGITKELGDQFDQVEVKQAETTRVASREAVRCTVGLAVRGQALLRQQAVVRLEPTVYFVLVFVSPQADADRATAVFDRVLASFEVLRSEKKDEQLREAMKRGTSVLASVMSGNVKLLDARRDETFLRCVIAGQDSGFIQVREEPAIREAREGLAVHKWAWLFRPDGGVSHLEHHTFVSKDLVHERWESRLVLLTPAPPGGGPEVLLDVETGIRQDNKLMLTYTPQPNAPRLKEKEITVEPPYAPAPWDILLPRLIDLGRPELYAFRLYDNARKGLSVRAFRVVGPETVRLGNRSEPGVKIEDSEGLIPPAHEIYVDQRGRLLRIVLQIPDSPMEMLQTDRQSIDRQFGTRVQEAQSLLRRLPIREPGPPERKKP